jgi:hypothetical protein
MSQATALGARVSQAKLFLCKDCTAAGTVAESILFEAKKCRVGERESTFFMRTVPYKKLENSVK